MGHGMHMALVDAREKFENVPTGHREQVEVNVSEYDPLQHMCTCTLAG